MKTVLVCNQKGGVGKTLISDELAFAFERDKIPYNYYDLDQQGGAIHRTKEMEGAEVQIIDTPGAIQKELIDWIKEADFIVVPTRLTPKDVPPLETMIEILEPFKDKKPVLYVMNCWNRFNASRDFEVWFKEKYPDLKSCVLCQSEMFVFAAAMQGSIVDYKADALPSDQIRYIYNCVKFQLGIREGWRD